MTTDSWKINYFLKYYPFFLNKALFPKTKQDLNPSVLYICVLIIKKIHRSPNKLHITHESSNEFQFFLPIQKMWHLQSFLKRQVIFLMKVGSEMVWKIIMCKNGSISESFCELHCLLKNAWTQLSTWRAK